MSRGARWGLSVAGHKDSGAHALAERGIRVGDIAHSAHLLRRGSVAQGSAMAANGVGRFIGGERGDQIASVGVGGSQLLGMKGSGLKGATAKTAGVMGAAWAASILIRDKKAAEALVAPAMAGAVARFAVDDAIRARAAWRGQAVAPRKSIPLGKPGRFVAAKAKATRSAMSRQAAKSVAGRATMQLSGKVAATAGARALASLGPVGLVIRGHALLKAGAAAARGDWKQAGTSVLDAALFGDGSVHLIAAAGRGAMDCARDTKACAQAVGDFAKRSRDKLVEAGRRMKRCMHESNRDECIRRTLERMGNTLDKARQMGADLVKRGHAFVKKHANRAIDAAVKHVNTVKRAAQRHIDAAKKKYSKVRNHIKSGFKEAWNRF